MQYILKHKDISIIRFELIENLADPVVHINWTDKKYMHLMPLDLEMTDEGLSKWLKRRTIPKNRAYVNGFLAKCGLNINRPMNIISVSKGLSLNDVYWVVEDGFTGTFAQYNLYDNNFSQILALIAFTGYGSSVRSSLASCPEFTTNGNLKKCWRRLDGKVYLYKGGTSGASNTGNEPFSEYYASEIAKTMGLDAVGYKLSKWKGELCSVCEAFTSLDYSYMPIGKLITSGGIEAVRKYYKKLGQEFVDALDDMLVFDAVICNTDRHFGNFGVLINNKNNKIAKPAPLFDHGNSLFNFAGREDVTSSEAMQDYIDTLLPVAYDDFFAMAKSVMKERHREQLRSLLTYKIKKNVRYNVSQDRYEMICEQVQKRARKLLGE